MIHVRCLCAEFFAVLKQNHVPLRFLFTAGPHVCDFNKLFICVAHRYRIFAQAMPVHSWSMAPPVSSMRWTARTARTKCASFGKRTERRFLWKRVSLCCDCVCLLIGFVDEALEMWGRQLSVLWLFKMLRIVFAIMTANSTYWLHFDACVASWQSLTCRFQIDWSQN